ncbi:MAG: hypothetical protein ABIK44_04090 [candidate division WOR-3 bacterium]
MSGGPNVFYSTDFGQSWLSCPVAIDSAFCLAIHPRDAQTVYAATNRGLFRTTDQGAHWTSLYRGRRLTSVRLYPDGPDTIFVGGDSGVAVSTDGGISWQPFNAGLGNKAITWLEFAGSGGVTIFCGTNNSAAYRYSFGTGLTTAPREPAPCPTASIRPCPSRGVVTLKPGRLGLPLLVRLQDVSGRTVLDQSPIIRNGEIRLDLTGIPAGVYQLELVTTRGAVRSRLLLAR